MSEPDDAGTAGAGDSRKQPQSILQGGRRWLLSAALLILMALSWTTTADEFAHTQTVATFKKALAAAALARTFNGVISVAQGTEVAIQPVGVGVTLTLGEILDPLNDLVERFSLLALAASISLGMQMTLGDMVANTWLAAALNAAALGLLALLWWPRAQAASPLRQSAAAVTTRIVGALIFLRFAVVTVLLICHGLNEAFFNNEQDAAMAELTAASEAIETLQSEQQQQQAEVVEGDFFDRTGAQLKNLLDSSSQSLDLQAQLAQVEEKIESSVEDMIRLTAIFILQTMLLPLLSVWLVWKLLQAFWSWNRPP